MQYMCVSHVMSMRIAPIRRYAGDMTGASPAQPDGTADADGGPALFRMVRFRSRRRTMRASDELTGQMRHVQHSLVV
jgi:hypothetical protein